MKKLFLLLAVLALPAFLFAAPSQQPASGGGYLRFAWWGNATRDERTQKAIDLFVQRNPGVTIEPQIGTFGGGYWDVLAAQAASRDLPDVIQQDVSYIMRYADQLADLRPFANRGLIDLSKWPQASLGNGTINNRMVGLLLGINALNMGVDSAVLSKAGITFDDTKWSWADYEKICVQIFQQTGVQTYPAVQIRHIIESLCLQTNSSLFTADGRQMGIATNPQALAALRNYLEMELRLMAAGALYDPDDAFIQGRAMAEEPLERGKTWNMDFWNNQIEAHQAAAGRTIESKMIPSIAGNSSPGMYLRSSMYISMAENSTNKDLAAKFINFFLNDLEANRILLGERGIPVPTDVKADLYSRVSPGTQYAFDYIDRITPFASSGTNYPANAGEVETMLQNVTQRILMGRTTLDAGLQEMVRESNAILAR